MEALQMKTSTFKCDWCGQEFTPNGNLLKNLKKNPNKNKCCCQRCYIRLFESQMTPEQRAQKSLKCSISSKKMWADATDEDRHRLQNYLKSSSEEERQEIRKRAQETNKKTLEEKDEDFWSQKKIKSKETRLKNGTKEKMSQFKKDWWQSLSDEDAQAMSRKHKETNSKIPQDVKDAIKQRQAETAYETYKRNNTFTKSKRENSIEQILTIHDLSYEREVTYPDSILRCDFVIEGSYWVEYNEWWEHGYEAFDPDNEKHIKRLDTWKERNYKHAIKIWTVKDPKKRQIAKDNNLMLLEFWNLEQFQKWLNLTFSLS
jgi:hypothetical protein